MQQIYDDLAWGSLQGTDAFNNLPEAEQERIVSVMYAEFLNSNNSSENILGLSPKGTSVCP